MSDFLERIKNYPCVVATISPQARASLSVHYGLDDRQMHLALMLFFSKLGIGYMFDQSFGVDLAMIEAQKEFAERLAMHEQGDKQ